MPQNMPLLDRAYEIARSGEAKCLQDVRLQLRREGYAYMDVLSEIQGDARRSHLLSLIEASRVLPGDQRAS